MGGIGRVKTEALGIAARGRGGRRARPHQPATTEDGRLGLQVGTQN